MTGVYFSGTGNTRYCVESFVREFDPAGEAYPLEGEEALEAIRVHDELVMGYPVQFSNLPKLLRDFVAENGPIWKGKCVFIIATMGLFSGDGAGLLGRLLSQYGAVVTGGLHLKMPDSIGDEKALKRPLRQNQELVRAAEQKLKAAARAYKEGRPSQEGLSFWSHLAGLFGQRLYFQNKTRTYSDKLKIDQSQCVRCGACAARCPMRNLVVRDGRVTPQGRCTMCYRCVNLCPAQAITLLGKRVYEQCYLEKYL